MTVVVHPICCVWCWNVFSCSKILEQLWWELVARQKEKGSVYCSHDKIIPPKLDSLQTSVWSKASLQRYQNAEGGSSVCSEMTTKGQRHCLEIYTIMQSIESLPKGLNETILSCCFLVRAHRGSAFCPGAGASPQRRMLKWETDRSRALQAVLLQVLTLEVKSRGREDKWGR